MEREEERKVSISKEISRPRLVCMYAWIGLWQVLCWMGCLMLGAYFLWVWSRVAGEITWDLKNIGEILHGIAAYILFLLPVIPLMCVIRKIYYFFKRVRGAIR